MTILVNFLNFVYRITYKVFKEKKAKHRIIFNAKIIREPQSSGERTAAKLMCLVLLLVSFKKQY